MEGACWRVGDIEEEGRTMFGTPMAKDNDNSHALSGIEGQF